MGMAEGTFEILNEGGLHARPATRLVQTASRYNAEVQIEHDGNTANAKSVMGVLLLCCHKGTRVTVRAQGDDADAVVAAIGELIRGRFGGGP